MDTQCEESSQQTMDTQYEESSQQTIDTQYEESSQQTTNAQNEEQPGEFSSIAQELCSTPTQGNRLGTGQSSYDRPMLSELDLRLLEAVKSDNVDSALTILEETKQGQGHLSSAGLDAALLSACRHGQQFLVQALVRSEAHVNVSDQHGNTPLLLCAERGFTELVRFLLNRGASVNVTNSDGNTALILAVRSSGSLNMIELLYKQADINIHHQNHHGYTALMKAIEARDVDAMIYLLGHGRCRRSVTGNETIQNMQKETAHDIAKRVGLGDIFKFLTESTPLMKAALACDVQSTNIFLDAELSNMNNKNDRLRFLERLLEAPITDTEFNSKGSDIIKILLKRGVDINANFYNAPLLIMATEMGSYEILDLFCQYGAEINSNSYRDALVIAAGKGRFDLIELLLKYGANINRKDWKSNYEGSALNAALDNGHIECGKFLLERGAHMDFKKALYSAVRHPQPLYVKFLFENYKKSTKRFRRRDIRKSKMSGLTEYLVAEGNLEIINIFLNAGVDVNCVLANGETPLMFANKSEVAQLLIQRGADVNKLVTRGSSGQTTALLKALSSSHKNTKDRRELIQVLLENGAEVNISDSENKTALMLAAADYDSEVTRVLLEHGADVMATNNNGQTALMFAVEGKRVEIVKFLLEAMKDHEDIINCQSDKGETALIMAAGHCSLEVINLLTESEADVNICDEYGETALMKTVKCSSRSYYSDSFSRLEIVKRIIKAGADVNHQNKEGLSALMMAVTNNDIETAEILVNAGADVNAVNNRKPTALSILFEEVILSENQSKLVELLVKQGAKLPFLKPETLHLLILQGKLHIVPLLISSGLAPVDVLARKLKKQVKDLLRDGEILKVSAVLSPFCLALLKGFHTLARYFADNWFLTSSDVITLTRNENVRKYLERQESKVCLEYLEEFLSQPMPLYKLAFIVVSSAVGSGPGREERVSRLTVSFMIKDRLLFRKEIVQLPENSKEEAVITTSLVAVPSYEESDDNDSDDWRNYSLLFTNYDN